MNLPCDPARRGRKDRFAYSLTVVHFRKTVIYLKVGSQQKGETVIYLCVYMMANYQGRDFYVSENWEKKLMVT